MVMGKRLCEIISIGDNLEKWEPSCIPGWDIKWYSGCGKVWWFFKKLNIAVTT